MSDKKIEIHINSEDSYFVKRVSVRAGDYFADYFLVKGEGDKTIMTIHYETDVSLIHNGKTLY